MSGTSGAITFSYPTWAARFPVLAQSVQQPLAQELWTEAASLFLDPGPCSPVQYPTKRGVLLNLIVAHMAQLYLQQAEGNTLVGRVASASEGSVSVSTDALGLPGAAAYWAQTPYGLQVWQATAFMRQARYVAAPRPAYGYGGRW